MSRKLQIERKNGLKRGQLLQFVISTHLTKTNREQLYGLRQKYQEVSNYAIWKKNAL